MEEPQERYESEVAEEQLRIPKFQESHCSQCVYLHQKEMEEKIQRKQRLKAGKVEACKDLLDR